MKKILVLLVAVTLVLSFTNIVVAEIHEPEQDCVNIQLERLRELRGLLRNRDSNNFETILLSADGEPIEIPNIFNFAAPTTDFNYFTIRLDVGMDHSYENADIIHELAVRGPAREVVDFILDFTGIPYERAEISYAIFQIRGTLPHGAPLPAICPVWGTPNPALEDSPNTTDIFSLSTFASSMSGRIIIVIAIGIALLLLGIKLALKA